MLAVARGLAGERRPAQRPLCELRAEALPFADASIDLVTCRIAPHHFDDVRKFVMESARVLRPGGLFGLVDNVSPDRSMMGTAPARSPPQPTSTTPWKSFATPAIGIA